MIDLKKMCLPQTVKVNNKLYNIHVDFHFWLMFLDVLKNKNASLTDFDFMYKDKIPDSRLQGLYALIEFCNPCNILPRAINASDEKIFDYDIDSDYIYSAFFEVYKIDLIETKLHWHKFLALLKGLHDTKFNEIINFRLYEAEGKKDAYAKHMEALKRAWTLPNDTDNTNDKDLIEFEALLN